MGIISTQTGTANKPVLHVEARVKGVEDNTIIRTDLVSGIEERRLKPSARRCLLTLDEMQR